MKKIAWLLIATGLVCLAACGDWFEKLEKSPSYHWERMPDFPGEERHNFNYFVIGNEFYMGLGSDSVKGCYYDFWVLDLKKKEWTRLYDYPYYGMANSHCFSIGQSAYMRGSTTGGKCPGIRPFVSFCLKYTIEKGWQALEKEEYIIPQGRGRHAFAYIKGTPYLIMRDAAAKTRLLYYYNMVTDVYMQRPTYKGQGEPDIFFGINDKGYAGMTWDEESKSREFWEYNTQTDSWQRLNDFTGAWRVGTASFGIGSRGYIMGGNTAGHAIVDADESGLSNEVWEYNPGEDTWGKVSEMPFKSVRPTAIPVGKSAALIMGNPNEIWLFTVKDQID